MFWNHPPPLGGRWVPRRKLIDADEFAITLNKCNQTGGWALVCHRVRKEGHYKHGLKITALLAIEGGDSRLPAHMDGSVEQEIHHAARDISVEQEIHRAARDIGPFESTFDHCRYEEN